MSKLCNHCDCTTINGTRCHETGCPNESERIVLTDDGTLDTVFKCMNCNEEMRFFFDAHTPECDEKDPNCDCYDDFVYATLCEIQDEHECHADEEELTLCPHYGSGY